MKFSIFPLILSAGLAITQATAAPLRVVIVSSSVSGNGFVRVGQTADNMRQARPNIAALHPVATMGNNGMHMKPKHGCAGARAKALQLSNWFRHALGMPAIEPHKGLVPNVHIVHKGGSAPVVYGNATHGPHAHVHNHHAHRHTFVQRLTRALMVLGPWEGRAVSFILGCGIGVLLRMFWVLAVLAVRSVRGKREHEEFNEDEVIFEEEEHLLAPPQYAEAYVVTEEKAEKVEEAPRA